MLLQHRQWHFGSCAGGSRVVSFFHHPVGDVPLGGIEVDAHLGHGLAVEGEALGVVLEVLFRGILQSPHFFLCTVFAMIATCALVELPRECELIVPQLVVLDL